MVISVKQEPLLKNHKHIDAKRVRRSNGLTTVTADGLFVRIFSRICLLWLQLQPCTAEKTHLTGEPGHRLDYSIGTTLVHKNMAAIPYNP